MNKEDALCKTYYQKGVIDALLAVTKILEKRYPEIGILSTGILTDMLDYKADLFLKIEKEGIEVITSLSSL